jgi:solute carrier family 15 (peptide/histidine transporter), member 3/4
MLTVSTLPVFNHDGCSSYHSKSLACSMGLGFGIPC